jgi:hypothetical protein
MAIIDKGDHSYKFVLETDGDDIVVRNVKTTWFGGDTDPDDSGETASGRVTKGNPGILGCALPMDLSIESPANQRPRNYPPTRGSGLPRIPSFTKPVVSSEDDSITQEIELIDIGPNKRAGSIAGFDPTQAAFVALGGKADFKHNSGDMICHYRIPGGVRYLPPAWVEGT